MIHPMMRAPLPLSMLVSVLVSVLPSVLFAAILTLPLLFMPPFVTPSHGQADEPLDAPIGDTAPDFEATDWDSVFTAFDRGIASEQRTKLEPIVGFGYSKVEGIHAEGGLAFGPLAGILERIELRAGYDWKRAKPTAAGRLRLGPGGPEIQLPGSPASIAFEIEGWSGARATTRHDPFANAWLTLLGGYDARGYVLERSGVVYLVARPNDRTGLRLGLQRLEQSPLEAVEQSHLFGDDVWMSTNSGADRFVTNGARLELRRRAPFPKGVVVEEVYANAVAAYYGGGLLGGEREYARFEAQLFRRFELRSDDAWSLTFAGGSLGGRAPRQARFDLGGEAGLFAYRPGSFVGDASFAARVQYEYRRQLDRKTKAPLLRRFGVALVPFAEVGAAWGEGFTSPASFRGPRPEEIRGNVGFGVRKSLEATGRASHLQVNLAWPVGYDRGPLRVTVSVSEDGLD